ncbi:MAG: hypothetical protein SFU85_02930 [Candidatus Methylacidiphilales bacterium]|nr:hypothetical protein [Candidatus Methylacidiphilales bacterium]
MNTLFLVTRILAALASVAGLALAGLIWFVRDTLQLAKEGVGVLGYVIQLFTSGFTQGTAPEQVGSGWISALPQAGLAVLFLAMLVAVFLPESRPVLHAVGLAVALTAGALLFCVFTTPRLEVLTLPLLLVWAGYYLIAVWKK